MRVPASRKVACAALGLAGALAGCNLVFGIDEQGPRPEPVDASDEEVADSAPPARPAFERCTSDADCRAPNGCYTPHCDRVVGACTYALCEAKGETCAMSACDTATFTCGPPKQYGFRSTTYSVIEATSGCGADPDACAAAVFPFLFLGTRDAIVALRVDDLVATTATKILVEGVGVKPAQLVTSGRRLWVLGAPQGTVPPYQLPVAVVDVPSDPTVTTLRATTSFLSYPYPTAVGFPAPNGALYVAFNDASHGLPVALVDAPVKASGTFAVASAADAGTYDAGAFDAGPGAPAYTMFRAAGVPAGAALVASSGARLVAARGGVVSLVEGAGSATAVHRADQAIVPAPQPLGALRFVQGPDGVVAWSAPVIGNNPAPDCDCITYERVQWMLPNAIATAVDQNQLVNAEGFRNPPATPGVCYSCSGYFTQPSLATWIDARTLLFASPASGGPNLRERTAVRVVTRDPITAPPQRRVLTRAAEIPKGDFATDRIALTSSNGFGYLVMADSQGNDVTVSIFDPRCDVPDAGE